MPHVHQGQTPNLQLGSNSAQTAEIRSVQLTRFIRNALINYNDFKLAQTHTQIQK